MKCSICGIDIEKENVFKLSYVNNNGKTSIKKGHKNCVKDWHYKYTYHKKTMGILLEVLSIDASTALIERRIREVARVYSYELIINAIKNKKIDIYNGFVNKNFNYCIAIIENECAKLKAMEKRKNNVVNELFEDEDIDFLKKINTKKPRRNNNTRVINIDEL